jgi:hypothetical protein
VQGTLTQVVACLKANECFDKQHNNTELTKAHPSSACK